MITCDLIASHPDHLSAHKWEIRWMNFNSVLHWLMFRGYRKQFLVFSWRRNSVNIHHYSPPYSYSHLHIPPYLILPIFLILTFFNLTLDPRPSPPRPSALDPRPSTKTYTLRFFSSRSKSSNNSSFYCVFLKRATQNHKMRYQCLHHTVKTSKSWRITSCNAERAVQLRMFASHRGLGLVSHLVLETRYHIIGSLRPSKVWRRKTRWFLVSLRQLKEKKSQARLLLWRRWDIHNEWTILLWTFG